MSPRTRLAVRFTLLAVVLVLLSPAATGALTYDPGSNAGLRAGTVTDAANGTTVISVQGFVFDGNTNGKKPARLVGVGERGETRWVHGNVGGDAWFFDVDPLSNGHLLVSSPRGTETLVYELDPDTGERVWERRLAMDDTHDIDRLGPEELLIANMREWNETTETSGDRVVVYNLTTDNVTWEWRFRDHFPPGTDGGQNADWSHVNDVDPIGDGRILVSPRNFDQVLVVDRESGEIVTRLGADDRYDVLRKQHNPDYLVSENGTPTVLVADSGNNRVVEYAYEGGEWVRTWSVGSNTLTWPRDADRLPNGNTLVTDSLNHRVIEITPRGEVVWEYYAPWAPYDAERVVHGDGSQGPTIRDLNASGTYDLTGETGGGPTADRGVSFPQWLHRVSAETVFAGPVASFTTRWSHVGPWVRPVWMTSWDLVFALAAAVVLVGWGVVEAAVARRRLAALLRATTDAVRR